MSRILLPALACGLAGCAAIPQRGMADRCVDFLTRADPGAAIAVTRSNAAATSLTAIVATVEGRRTDLAASAKLPRRVAVECRFDNGVLTQFHWTKGPA